MQDKRIYTITETKLEMAYYEGFKRLGSTLYAQGGMCNFLILNRFCSYERESKWGRFHCKASLSPSSTLKIYAFAVDAESGQEHELNAFFHNQDIPIQEKRGYFMRGGVSFVNHEDVLLYALQGEYLWIAVEIEEAGNDRLYDMRLDSQGDNFMQTFPEIYQEENGFFHRYMSVFSSVYQDLSDEIAGMDRYLNIETTPLPVLMQIADWFGFEAEGDFLDEELLRRLIKEIYALNRIKGTKQVLQNLIRAVLEDEAYIIERNRMRGYIPRAVKETYQKLYGSAMQDVTVLIKRPEDEKLQSQMMYLLQQFKPVRSRVRLVFSNQCSNMDSYCYLDYNAALSSKGYAHTDNNNRMNGTVILQ
ncbi:MAG: hypothetical protein K2P44_12625 [Lachnospiraceae bacterium]|nr:hypothetical protein [Lachnospiraceae bacterium]